MTRLFNNEAEFNDIEKLYPPPTRPNPPTESESIGSSNHAETFNARLQGLVNRTFFLKQIIDSGILKNLRDLVVRNSTYIGFDNAGKLAALDPPQQLIWWDVGDIKMTAVPITSNPYQDHNGYLWYYPNGTLLNNSNSVWRQLYLKLWETLDVSPPGKGVSALSDWDAGKSLVYPDVRGQYILNSNNVRAINTISGNNEYTLKPEHYRHSHNLSFTGIQGSNAVFQYGGGLGHAVISFGAAPTNLNQIDRPGNRRLSGDDGGSVWENTPNPQESLTIEPSGVALNMLVFTGVKL